MEKKHTGPDRARPVRIARMTIEPRPSSGPDAPLLIRADLDPQLDRGELPWWMEQLRGRAGVLSWGGQGRPQDQMSVVAVQVDAPADQLEAVARRLVAAVEEANAAYPDHYLPWRRERDAQLASEQQRQEQRRAKHQAVLDNVLAEHRRNADCSRPETPLS